MDIDIDDKGEEMKNPRRKYIILVFSNHIKLNYRRINEICCAEYRNIPTEPIVGKTESAVHKNRKI